VTPLKTTRAPFHDGFSNASRRSAAACRFTTIFVSKSVPAP
jgi:hypothetical protein